MSKIETTELTCPACGQKAPFSYYSSANVTLEPDLKARLLDGSLSRFTCPACSHRVNVNHPLLYHDMERGLMIQLDFSGQATAASFGDFSKLTGAAGPRTTRIVHQKNDLVEKVLALGAGLDDRSLEVMKLVASAQEPQLADAALYFEALEGDEMRLAAIKGDQHMGVQIPRTLYDNVHADLSSRGLLPEAEAWPVVDRDYALSLIERRG